MKKLGILIISFILILTSCNVSNEDDPQVEIPPQDDKPIEEVNNYGNILDYISEEGQIPLVRIKTKRNEFPQDKENYVDGALEIVMPNEEEVTLFEYSEMGIRLRGNSTLACPKKAFRIKFEEKQSLFGLEKAKSWVLLANYYDKSNIRNYLAYLTARKLDNLGFQPSGIFVNVEFNNQFMGLYLLCEQMQTGKGRVDIEIDNAPINESSFFIELDFIDRIIEDGLVSGLTYVTSYSQNYAFKYPDEEDMTPSRATFVKTLLDNINKTIRNKSGYEDYIDIDSMIDYYFIQELFKNVDGIQSSVYYYIQNGKLYAGPVWDFDLGLDVVGPNSVDNVYDSYAASNYWIKDNGNFYKDLFKDPVFFKKVQERYTEVRSTLFEVFNEIELIEELLSDELSKNEKTWSIPGYLDTWVAQRYSYEYLEISSTTDHIRFVQKELVKQFYLLDQIYLLY